MNTLIPVTSEMFRENVTVRFNNILDGLNNYLNFEIKGNDLDNAENAIINFITEIFAMNNNEGYVDLYLNNLDNTAKEFLLNMCCHEDKDMIIKHIELNHPEPYYKITDKALIPFLVRLNTYEVFFVTFYFTKIPLTIWGNYNMSFPCFTDSQENLTLYMDTARKYQLL